MAHSSGSTREMVRQYREELSCQTTNDDVPQHFVASFAKKNLKSNEANRKMKALFPNEEHYVGNKRLENKRHVWWHDSLTNTEMQEKAGFCTPLKIGTKNWRNFQDLDHHATKVLQCSFGKDKQLSQKNHCRARGVVARNFEEIDQILGKSNLVMEISSSCDIQRKALDFTKVKKEMQQTFNKPKFGLDPRFFGGAKHLKQDTEVREEAAIKAANYYLNKDYRDLNIQSKTLLDNPIKEKFACVDQHSINASYKLVNSRDQACYMSTFNANKQEEWQTTMPLHVATLETCQGTMICDKLVCTNSSTTPITHLKVETLRRNESNKQQFNNSGQVDSKTKDFPSMMERKNTLKYEEINLIEDCFDTTKLLKWEVGLPLSSKNYATTIAKQQPRIMDIEQYPFSTMDKLMHKSSKMRDIFSVQMSPSHATCIWQKLGVYNLDVPISKSTQKLVKRASYGSLCLEDGMRQLSNEDLLLALENPSKVHATLKSLPPKEQFDASCGSHRSFKLDPYLPPKKSVIDPMETESSFTGSLDGKDELTANPAILASFEQDYEEASDQLSPQGLEFQCYLKKSNPIEKSKLSHLESSTHLQCSNAKFRGTKDKDNKSPAWMHSLNVRKPTKWRATSTTHTRLQSSPASQRKQLALRQDRSKDTTSLASVVDSVFKGRAENNFFDDNNDAITTTTTVAATWQARIASGFAEIAEPATSSSELATIQVKPSSDDSYLNGWIHGGSADLTKLTSIPGVLTTAAAQENCWATDCLFGQHDSRLFYHQPENPAVSSNLDHLISEVVYEWVESCGAPLPASSACDESQEDRASKSLPGDSDLVTDVKKTSVAALASVVQPLLAALQETQIEESIVKEFEADETICLLLEKLQFYETKIRALKSRRKNKNF